jgi:hypothetical protein
VRTSAKCSGTTPDSSAVLAAPGLPDRPRSKPARRRTGPRTLPGLRGPAPVIAEALGYHDKTATRLAAEAGEPEAGTPLETTHGHQWAGSFRELATVEYASSPVSRALSRPAAFFRCRPTPSPAGRSGPFDWLRKENSSTTRPSPALSSTEQQRLPARHQRMAR